MDIKNFLHQKKENKKKQTIIGIGIFILIITTITVGFFLKKKNHNISYQIGEQIQFLGTISYNNNYPISTHKISDSKFSFGLKSSTTNLNNFINKTILLNGIINNISNNIPILEITNIKIPESKIIINENRYFFVNELIMLDFSKDLDLKAEKNGKNINIYYHDEPVLSIETFVCSKVASTQDCSKMITHFSKSLSDIFRSYFGHVFYKNKNTSRVTFNEETLGYIFKTTENNFLLDISHLIHIIDSNFIIKNKNDLIMENCVLEDQKLNKINKNHIEIIDEDLIAINIKGLNNTNQEISCKLTINIREDRKIKTKKITNQ